VTRPPHPLREVLAAYALVFAGTAALGAVRTGTWVDDLAQVGIALLFLGVPLRLARREPDGAARYGVALGGLLEPVDDGQPAGPFGLLELGRALRRAAPDALREFGVGGGGRRGGVSPVVVGVVPFVVGFWLWHAPGRDFALRFSPDFGSFALAQFLLVGLPEEAFFRGFVQTRLTDHAESRGGLWAPRRVLGAALSVPALLLGSALFALVHLASEPRPDELATFFPGLVFGWLRARRGGIGAALSFHALSNVLADVLVRSWL
jgi:membrane protease YdiL (CAAX protease family)